MKVLFISNDPTIFDATSSVRARMRTYAALMEELHILSAAGPHTKEEQEGNLFLHPLRSSKFLRIRSLAHRARVLISEHGIEVVSAQDPFEHGLAALWAVHGTHAKLHIQIHTDFLSPWFVQSITWRDMRMSFLNQCRLLVADYVLSRAIGIRTVSKRIKNSLVVRYGTHIPEISIIPVSVSTEKPEPLPLPAHGFNFVLIAVGRLESEKRVEDMLVALKLAIQHYPMLGLYIIGSGRERARLEKMTQALNLGEHAIFLGERRDARALMGSAHAFIQASAYEGYGRTLIEAALARIPIITTNVGIVGEVFNAEADVLIAPIADPVALAHIISTLIEDTLVRQKLVMNADASARAHLAPLDDLPSRIVSDLEWVLSV